MHEEELRVERERLEKIRLEKEAELQRLAEEKAAREAAEEGEEQEDPAVEVQPAVDAEHQEGCEGHHPGRARGQLRLPEPAPAKTLVRGA